jgi:hypothetical protein
MEERPETEKNERERSTQVSFNITILNYQARIRFLFIFYFLKSMYNENSLVFLVIGLWIYFFYGEEDLEICMWKRRKLSRSANNYNII